MQSKLLCLDPELSGHSAYPSCMPAPFTVLTPVCGAQRVSFRAMFPDASAQAIDLLERMLQFNPTKRITVEDALAHPYLAQLHNPALEPSAPGDPSDPCTSLDDLPT